MKNLIILILLILSMQVMAQSSIEVTAGAGATAIDLDKLVAEDDPASSTTLNNWDTFSAGLSVQGIFTDKENFNLGAEVMYHYLYYYETRDFFFPSPIFREYYVETYRLAGFVRIGNQDGFHIDAGPSINISDGVGLGVLLSLNYAIAVTDKISIPLKLRSDIMGLTVLTVPITANVGVRVNLK